MSVVSFSDLAREVGCKPRDISDLFYGRTLDESRLVPIAGRRLIPTDYVADVRRALEERGKVRREPATAWSP